MDKELRKLKKVKIKLMRTPQFVMWQGIMMLGDTSISDAVPTACTDGRNEMYGRAFIKELEEKELGFVILHETLHKAFRHLTVYKRLHEENPQLANMACDYVINLILVDADPHEKHIAMPKRDGKPMGLLDRKYGGMNSKDVFHLLKQEQESTAGQPGTQKEGDGNGDGTGDGEGFDEHDWDAANKLTKVEEKKLVREIDRALRQGQIAAAKLAGEGTGSMDRAVDELLAPYVDWRELLREFVTSICSHKDTSSWRRINRRYLASDIYMPSLVGESLGCIAIGIDTSGSISQKEMTRFLSEVQGIADNVNPEKVHLIYWDAAVKKHEEYSSSDLPNLAMNTKPVGGGGTDPTCMQNYLIEKGIVPECIVMLTDGYVYSWGDKWNAPILWTITAGGKDIEAPCGKTINIQE